MKKYFILLNLIGLLFLTVFTFDPAFAQGPATDFRLISWSQDGDFWIVAKPDGVVTLANGQQQQQSAILLIPVSDGSPTQLATGFELSLAPNAQSLYYSSVVDNSQRQNRLDLATRQINQIQRQEREAVAGHKTDPPGRLFWDSERKQRAILVNRHFQAQLWLGQPDEPAQLLLQATGELFSEVSWRPDGQALIFIRTPLGSGTTAQSEAWHPACKLAIC